MKDYFEEAPSRFFTYQMYLLIALLPFGLLIYDLSDGSSWYAIIWSVLTFVFLGMYRFGRGTYEVLLAKHRAIASAYRMMDRMELQNTRLRQAIKRLQNADPNRCEAFWGVKALARCELPKGHDDTHLWEGYRWD